MPVTPAKAEAEPGVSLRDYQLSSVRPLCGYRASASSHSEVLALNCLRGHCSLPESGWVPGHLAGQAPPGLTPLESYSHTCLATSFLFHFLLSIHVLLDDRILMRNVLW